MITIKKILKLSSRQRANRPRMVSAGLDINMLIYYLFKLYFKKVIL